MTTAMRTALFGVLVAALASPLLAHEGLHEQIQEVSQRIVEQPRNAALYLKRGELLRLHAEWRLAAADYDRAEQLAPQLSAIHLARGTMLLDSGHAPAALAPLRHYLQLHPDDPRARVILGRALVQSGHPAEGAAAFTAVLDRSPQPDPDLAIERARALASAKQPEEALRGLDDIMSKIGPLVTLQLAAIDIETAAGRYPAALRRIDTAAATAVRKETWLARRGDILLQAHRPTEAQTAYREALSALQTLPEGRRRTRAATELEERLQTALHFGVR
jgi:predicted Zn-dependent protease